MPRPRYVFSEAWSVARSSPRQTAAAITLIALALYVPGLLALVSHNLGRLAVTEADPTAVVLTLDGKADPHALASKVQGDGVSDFSALMKALAPDDEPPSPGETRPKSEGRS